MKILSYKFYKTVVICLILFFFTGITHLTAQKVAINFDDYHGYTSTTNYLKQVASAYPQITNLLEIGKSTMGRPIYVLVISNKNIGTTIDAQIKLRNMRKEGVKNVIPMLPDQGKPGHWICGATHGNEYTGTEVCLYIIDKLVTGYKSDTEIKNLIDKKAFYICPIVNPDGVFNSIEKGISQRTNSMLIDNDNDGKINEDGPDDMNKDGYITMFRYKDDKGGYIIDEEDPRLMVRMNRNSDTTKQRYSVVREDFDNDGDGKRGEDSESGIDLNRNFPEGWFKDDGFRGGTGDYPTSAPESHAIVEFLVNHTNILIGQFYHTSGGFTYRPMGTAPHTEMDPKDVAVLDLIMGKKYIELIGEEVPLAWLYPDSIASYKEKLKKDSKNKYAIQRGYVLPRGWKVSYNEERDARYSFGMATDWMYKQFGAYSITTELWNSSKDIKDFPQFSGPNARVNRERAMLKYQDEKFNGKYFISWKKYKHPDLGQGEIGGWIPKYYGNNAFPGETLLGVCDIHWQFELFRAKLLPEVVITDASAKVIYSSDNASDAKAFSKDSGIDIKKANSKKKYKILEVSATVENKGALATHLAKGANLAGNRQDVVWLIGDPDKITFLQGSAFQKIGVLEGQMKIPGFKTDATPGRGQNGRGERQRRMGQSQNVSNIIPQKGPKRDVKWLIAVEGDTPIKIMVTSQKGGTDIKNLSIK
ncbi:M14 family metallopeptidase [Bacteroidota bacterium]